MSERAQKTEGCRRCTICALSLPNDPAWEKCPKCGESTYIIVNAGPNTTVAEATWLLRAREVKEYLEKEKRA